MGSVWVIGIALVVLLLLAAEALRQLVLGLVVGMGVGEAIKQRIVEIAQLGYGGQNEAS